jgi:hypothetical protein
METGQNSELIQQPQTPVKKRPEVLTVFLVITIATRIFAIFELILIIVLNDKVVGLIEEFYPKLAKDLVPILSNKLHLGLGILWSALQIAGAAFMWKLKKLGFHIYMIGKLGLLIAPFIIFGFTGNVFETILSTAMWSVWPIVYMIHLKYMD